jgi:hypothetical protein
LNQPEAFRVAAILFIVGAAMIIVVSYPTYVGQAVFAIGLVVVVIALYLFLTHIKAAPITPSS